MRRSHLSALAFPVSLGACVVLLFFGALLPPARVLVVRDIPMFHLPLRLVSSTLARDGWPLWNPMINGGQPILSNPNYAAFYPPTWLALVVPAHYAVSLIVVLHAAWAFAGAWLLARGLGCRAASSALAAVAFVAGGAFVAAPSSLNLYCGLAWLPWVLHWGEIGLRGADRAARVRGIVLTGGALAAQLVSGEPYSPTLGAIALLCLAVGGGVARWPRLAWRLAATLAVAALLGAAQLVPTLRHLADSPRSEQLSDQQTMTWSTRPDRFLEWVLPNLHGDPSRLDRGLFFGQHRHDRGSAYLPSIYVGQLVLILAAAALLRPGIPHRATWASLIVVGVALALGRHDPIYARLLVRVPPWSLLRYPEKFLLLATSGLAFAAALGWEQLLGRRERGDSRAATLPVMAGILVLAAAGGFLVLPFVRPDLARSLVEGAGATVGADTQSNRLAYLGLEAAVMFALALGSLAVLALHRARWAREWLLAVVVLGFLLADLHRAGRHWIVTAGAADLFEPPSAVALLPEPTGRVWSDQLFYPDSAPEAFDVDDSSSIPLSFVPAREQLLPYWANLWGIPYALNEDYDLMATAPARHALAVFRTRTKLVEEGWTDLPMVYLGAWNVCNVARRRTPEALREEFRHTGARPQRMRVLDNPFCLARYRFVSRAEVHSDLEAATASAERHGFDVSSVEFLVDAGQRTPSLRSYGDDGRLSRVEENGAQVDLTYSVSRDALLIAATTYDRNWHAEVDDVRVPVLPTAIGQMAIEVPPGTHRLVLRYRDPWVVTGVTISLAGLVGCLALWRLSLRRIRASAALRSPRA